MDTYAYDSKIRQDLAYYSDYRDYERMVKRVSDKKGKLARLDLFWDHRYQVSSYKARKAGISVPSVMMKYKNNKFRLYGDAQNNKLFDHAKAILAGWKVDSKAEMITLQPQYKAWLKENHLTARNNPFSYWNINIKGTKL